MKIIQIRVRDDTIRYIYDDALLSLAQHGVAEIRRASHVEPTTDGKWIADLSPINGPKLGPFQRRDEALQAEIAWIYQHQIPIPKELLQE